MKEYEELKDELEKEKIVYGAIIKIDKKINFFKRILVSFDSNFKIYTPKIKIKNIKKNKLKLTREIPIGRLYFLFS